MLDKVFGFKDKLKSRFKKVAQHYDEKKNEHVILIEYRIRRRENVVSRTKRDLADRRLIKYINTTVNKK